MDRQFSKPFKRYFANKQDLIDKINSIETISSELEISTTSIFPRSAILNNGIFEAFDYLIEEIMPREDDSPTDDFLNLV